MAEFYAARSATITPLPWSTLHRRFQLAEPMLGSWTEFAAAQLRGEVTAINCDFATLKTISGERPSG